MWYRLSLPFYEKAAKKMCKDCRDFIEKKSKILDLGCGSAIVTKKFENFFEAEVFGVDIEDKRIYPIPFKIINGNDISFPKNSFDVVLISYVLHHSEDPVRLLSQAKKVAKKIIIYEDIPEGFFSKFLCKFHGISFSLFFQKKKQKTNFKSINKWQEIFKELGLKLIYKKSFRGLPIYPVKKAFFVLEKI